MPNLDELKEQICEFGRRMWTRQLAATNDGNMSIRLDDGRFLVTPTGMSKGFMEPEDMVIVDAEGNHLEGKRRPSTEIRMHLYVYKKRPDVGSVCHAHPPTATAFAVAGQPLVHAAMTETIRTYGGVPIAPFAVPGGDELGESLADYVMDCDVILLANHGAITFGNSMEEAYHRMESLELNAVTILRALQLGGINLLTQEQVDILLDYRERMGYPGKNYPVRIVKEER